MKVTTGTNVVKASKAYAKLEMATVYFITEPQPYSEQIFRDLSGKALSLEEWVKEYIYKSLAAGSWLENTPEEKEDLEHLSTANTFERPEDVIEHHYVIQVSEHPDGALIWHPLAKGKTFEELWR